MSCIKCILFFKCFSLGSFQGMLYNFSKKFLDVQNTHLVRALMHVAARSTSSLEHGGNMLLYSKISPLVKEICWPGYYTLVWKQLFTSAFLYFPLLFNSCCFLYVSWVGARSTRPQRSFASVGHAYLPTFSLPHAWTPLSNKGPYYVFKFVFNSPLC